MGRASEAGFEQPNQTGYVDPILYNGPPSTDQTLALITTPGSQPLHSFLSQQSSQSSHSQSQAASSSQSFKRFAIPTKNDSLSSGFPFHPRLYDLKITHDQWHLFSSDIVEAAKMTLAEDWGAWTTGITTGTLTSPFLLVLAPVVGYYSGRAVHRKAQVSTVKQKLLQEGDLRCILKRWNETEFMQKGFQAWLELPRDPGELHKEVEENMIDEGKKPKEQKKVAKKAARRFRIIIIPNDDAPTSPGSSAGMSRGNGSSVISPTTPIEDPRGITELHDRSANDADLAEPPAYSDLRDEQVSLQAPISRRPVPVSSPSLSGQDESVLQLPSPEITYQRSGGFTNA